MNKKPTIQGAQANMKASMKAVQPIAERMYMQHKGKVSAVQSQLNNFGQSAARKS